MMHHDSIQLDFVWTPIENGYRSNVVGGLQAEINWSNERGIWHWQVFSGHTGGVIATGDERYTKSAQCMAKDVIRRCLQGKA